MKKTIIYTIGIASIISGCSSDEGGIGADIIDIPAIETIELTVADKTINNKVNDAAFVLLNQMAANYDVIKDAGDNSGNIILSPLSISLALTMHANSVDGTDKSICNLYGASDLSELNAYANKLMRYMAHAQDGTTVKLANSVWYAPDLQLSNGYISLMNKTFYAETTQADLTTTSGIDLVNSWVKAKTENMIERFFDEPQKLPVTMLNAMYFKGEWINKFACFNDKFHGSNQESSISMLGRTLHGNYSSTENFDMATLPYKGDATITVVIPKKMSVFEAAQIITLSDLPNISTDEKLIAVHLPKLSIAQDWNITQILSMLGINTYGTLNKMGLSGNTINSEILHKTSLDIDESGTKAAAVTGDTQFWSSGDPSDIHIFCDRPFLFFIRNTVTDTIIMCGCINNL